MEWIRRWLRRFALAVISRMGIAGRVRLTYRNANTGAISHVQQRNLFVNGGRNKIRDYLAGDAPSYPTHVVLSANADAVSLASTGTVTELVRGAVTQRVKSAQELQINAFFGTSAASGDTIAKVGLVDAASGGTFYAVALVVARVKDPNETLTVEWVLDLAG